jgi:hypothetical protein
MWLGRIAIATSAASHVKATPAPAQGSTASYAIRCSAINNGSVLGLNGAAKLDFGVTVLSDGAADSITGAASVQALDWFFASMGDKLHNVEAGEQINNI